MKTENVVEYLQTNPDFFEAHPELLIDLVVPHPYGGRTISLSERQMLMMRERVKELERKLQDWISVATENEDLQAKVHQYTLALFKAHDLATLQTVITRNMNEIFSVPHAVMHLWKEHPPSIEVVSFADQHTKPVCIHQPLHDTQSWFGENAAHLKSFAYLPLRNNTQSVGLLILASEEAQRFYPEMGTMFLQRIAEIVGSALNPHL